MPYAGIISPASARKLDETGEGYLVGSGPFILDEWISGQSIRLKRNPGYAWAPPLVENPGAPYLQEVEFKIIPDAATQLAALEAGEVDVVFLNQPSHLLKLQNQEDVRLEETVLNSLIYLGYNCQKSPYDEVLVRQALSHAVNKQEIVDLVLGSLGQVAVAPLPPSLPGFDPALQEHALGYDPGKAGELLAAAGFERTDSGSWQRDGQPLQGRLLTSTRPPNETIATLIQSHLQAIGVPIEIQQLDSKAVMDATAEGQFDLLLWRYDWNDPDALNIFLSGSRIGSTNRVGYGNPVVDALLEEAAHELDEEARQALYVEAQEVILQEAPWQPLYYPVDVIAIRDRIQGAQIGFMGRLLLNEARVVE
jgi:peptide/nickel transport system substrate-binding protein